MNDLNAKFETVLRQWELNDGDRKRLMEIARGDERAKIQLLEIAKLLDMLLPKGNAYGWVSRENKAFNNKPAIAVMRDEGAPGVERVFKYLLASI